MTVERLALGLEPRIEIGNCSGNLEVRGSEHEETIIEYNGSPHPDEQVAHVQDGAATIDNLFSDCTIRMPRGGSLLAETVGGDMEVKDIGGTIEVGHLGGDCSARRIGTLTITESVAGSIEIKDCNGAVQIGTVGGDCSARRVGSLNIGAAVSGDLTLKDVGGSIEAGFVGGCCSARHVGTLNVGEIGGDARIRYATGQLTLGSVGGSATLRDIDAPISIEQVSGDFLGRHLPFGVQAAQVSGNLVLRTDFNPETASHFTVSGNALLHIPESTSVRIRAQAGGRLSTDPSLQAVTENGHTVVTFGDGAATVDVTAQGNLSIKGRGDYDLDEEISVAFDDEFSAYIDNLSTQFQEKIETHLSDLPERIRSRVERKLGAARRHMEAAQRQVDLAVESATRLDHHPRGVRIDFDMGGEPSIEPVKDEERLLILQMLEDGRITVEEAKNLLAALEG